MCATIYASGVSAVLLPIVVGTFLSTVYAEVILEKIGEWRGGPALGALIAGLVLFLQARWMGVAVDLVRARGRAESFVALRQSDAWFARRRRTRFRMIVVAVSALSAFAVAEAAFRIFDVRSPAQPSSANQDWERTDYRLNALGLREAWDQPPARDARLRLVFLGDSMTYGDGVEPEEAFPHLVQELLSLGPEDGVLSLNLGFRGTSPGWQLEKYLKLRQTLFADVVVQVVYLNDLQIDTIRIVEIYGVRDGDLWTGDWSFVLRYAERQVRYWMAWNRTLDYMRGGDNDAARGAAWAKFKGDVRACKQAVEETDAVYAVVLFPWLVRLEDYPLADVHREMRQFVSHLDVPYLDLLEAFAGRDGDALRVSLANEHPNSEGHRLAAERIARFLRDEVLPLFGRK